MIKIFKEKELFSLNIQSSVQEAINILNNGFRACILVDEKRVISGIVTDGDVRRGLLKGIQLDSSVTKISNMKPFTINESQEESKIIDQLRKSNHVVAPVGDDSGRLVGLVKLEDIDTLHAEEEEIKHNTQVLIMAGGFGKRLRPLTNNIPKPMVKVQNKPILQLIIESFKRQGFINFAISVNYLADVIKNYFEDGKNFNINISYVEENEPLGTAGSLSLLDKSSKNIIMINGDILTKINFKEVLNFHKKNKADITICSKQYVYQLPYGDIELDSNFNVQGVVEKPINQFIISAGAYVLKSSIQDLIEKNEYLDMPDLINRALKKNLKVKSFLIHEDWIDIGLPSNLQEANKNFTSD